MALRHVGGRNQALVVDDADRFVGGAEGFVLPVGPLRQLGGFRRLVRLGVAVVDQLDLEVHGRRPGDVGRTAGGTFGNETVVELGRAHVAVFDLDRRVDGAEFADQVIGLFVVGDAIDHQLAFLLAGGDEVGGRFGEGRGGEAEGAG